MVDCTLPIFVCLFIFGSITWPWTWWLLSNLKKVLKQHSAQEASIVITMIASGILAMGGALGLFLHWIRWMVEG